ncbi:MAG: glycosyltransferase family 39 protein [Candidatus Bathyarchaeota archaeon]|nr:glycosyltransferase family 39 protein [Candidatus Bathyarchaeota archaeon]
MQLFLLKIKQHFNLWRLAIAVFLVGYFIVLLNELDYSAVVWDEIPHLYSGLILSRGQLQLYVQVEAFYPPLFNLITSTFFRALGADIFAARLVSVVFSVLSIWAVFEFGYKLYGPRTGLLSSILLASMPGILWLSRMAMIETMLMFFFTVSLLSFYCWKKTDDNKMLVLTGVSLGLGFLVKYQMVVAAVIMLVTLILPGRQYFRTRRKQFLFIALVAALVFLPWIIIVFQQYSSEMLGIWFYVIQMGNESRLAYSTRFFAPIFYLIEMTQPYSYIHPVYLPVYIISLLGLGLWFLRKKESDKFCLLSFSVVYIVFTLITSKDWRYVSLIFPVLAVSASELIWFLLDQAKEHIKRPQISFKQKNVIRIAAGALVISLGVSVVYSCWDAYDWIETDRIQIPAADSVQYVVEHTTSNDHLVVLCGDNFFSVDLVEFYLLRSDPNREQPLQYPEKAVDAYEPVVNVTWLIETCDDLNTKYLFLFEHGNNTFYESELTSNKVLEIMQETNRFKLEKTFGTAPRRIYVIYFV